jgi:hypothetical protein
VGFPVGTQHKQSAVVKAEQGFDFIHNQPEQVVGGLSPGQSVR